jgi:GNAT superfamily N-acetyltransferase
VRENLTVRIRPRLDSDLDTCASLTREVHALNGYPRFLPRDLHSFLTSAGEYGAWVTDLDGEITGHVALHRIALHPPSVPSAVEVASKALGRPTDRLAVVARLLVSPGSRGQGAGRLLLEMATAHAHGRGLWPVLDVDKGLAPAIALYERCGWVRAGSVTIRFENGQSLDEYVYLGPHSPSGDSR